MEFKYYWFLAKKNFFHKKINMITVFLLFISMTMIIFISSFSKTFTGIINASVNGNINHKALIINGNSSEISSHSNVFYTVPYAYYTNNVYTSSNESIHIISVPDDYIKTIKGKNLMETEEQYAFICPSIFYLGETPEEYDETFVKSLKDGSSYLNKILTIENLGYKENYKIVGIYDNNQYAYGDYNICFTRVQNGKEIEEAYQKYNLELGEQQGVEYINSSNQYTVAVVKDVTKIKETIEYFEHLGYHATTINSIDLSVIQFITEIFQVLSIFIMVITFLILLIYNTKEIQYNKKNNLIYKAIGYSDEILVKVNYLESFLLTLVSFLLSMIACVIIYVICKNVCAVDITLGTKILISYEAVFFSFLFCLFISLFATFLSIKSHRHSIMEALTDEEI